MFRVFKSSTKVLSHEELIDVYLEIRPKLERAIARRTGSLTLAADLAQELFFKIDTIKASIPTRIDAERYLLRAACNASLDYMKVEARRRAILQEAALTAVSAVVPSVEGGILAREDLARIEIALTHLPEKCRAVFVMSRFEGLSHTQIAIDLGVSKSLVEKYIVRALSHCRANLDV